jgi:hypothetical protein
MLRRDGGEDSGDAEMKYWSVSDMEMGDTIKVMVNNRGSRNLDGAIIGGTIKDLEPDYNMVRLESGWCCHTKDTLLLHQRKITS